MAPLLVGGIAIKIAPDGITRPREDLTDRGRAFDGTYRTSVTGNPKRMWQFSTPPVPRETADFYEHLFSAFPSLLCSGDLLGEGINLLSFPNDFDNAVWSKQATTITPNSTFLTLGGPTNVDLVLETAVGGTHGVYRVLSGITADTLQKTSVFVAPNARGWFYVQTYNKDAVTMQSWVNLSTGALGTVAAGHTVEVVSLGNGFLHVSVTWNSGSAGTPPEIAFFASTGDTVTSYAGDVTKGIFLVGASHSEVPVTCFPEITGWTPIKTGDGHRVVLDFSLHEA